ncbi:hypothetical protein BRADI_4g03270v3 [Brachypodium distachyon]|nr:hypothetical protein BRADI_4g03270v3 [Brachypodium distachyon]
MEFGLVLASDLPIYDGFGPEANLVARLQGLQSQAGKLTDGWQASVNIVFEDERFNGSTLHVMGTGLHKREWAIVGGTGEFTLAQGIMYNLLMYGEFQEIELRALYTPMKKVPWTLGVPGDTASQT